MYSSCRQFVRHKFLYISLVIHYSMAAATADNAAIPMFKRMYWSFPEGPVSFVFFIVAQFGLLHWKRWCPLLCRHVWIALGRRSDGDPNKVGRFHSPSLYLGHRLELLVVVRSGSPRHVRSQYLCTQSPWIGLWTDASGVERNVWESKGDLWDYTQ